MSYGHISNLGQDLNPQRLEIIHLAYGPRCDKTSEYDQEIPQSQTAGKHVSHTTITRHQEGGSVVECLTGDRRAVGSSLTRRDCFVSLSKNINPSLVLAEPRKTCPFITDILLMGRKESNQKTSGRQTKQCNCSSLFRITRMDTN